MNKRFFVIDCDTGVDDAIALLLALNCEDVEILAITCVQGNCFLPQAVHNTLVVISKIAKQSHVPVFAGCSKPLIQLPLKLPTHIHGSDGLGGASQEFGDVDLQQQTDHAVIALLQLVNKYPGQITLVTMGPLTNIAMALRMDDAFTAKLKNMVIMGGNTEGKGNIQLCAEFNFACDPEAARIVLEEAKCAYSVVGWETSGMNQPIDWDWVDKWLSRQTEKCKNILKVLEEYVMQKQTHKLNVQGFCCCDAYAMAVALNPGIVTEKINHQVTVEASPASTTRGMMITVLNDDMYVRTNNMRADIIQKIDLEQFKRMLENIME